MSARAEVKLEIFILVAVLCLCSNKETANICFLSLKFDIGFSLNFYFAPELTCSISNHQCFQAFPAYGE
jgi:hypothetical protein